MSTDVSSREQSAFHWEITAMHPSRNRWLDYTQLAAEKHCHAQRRRQRRGFRRMRERNGHGRRAGRQPTGFGVSSPGFEPRKINISEHEFDRLTARPRGKFVETERREHDVPLMPIVPDSFRKRDSRLLAEEARPARGIACRLERKMHRDIRAFASREETYRETLAAPGGSAPRSSHDPVLIWLSWQGEAL